MVSIMVVRAIKTDKMAQLSTFHPQLILHIASQKVEFKEKHYYPLYNQIIKSLTMDTYNPTQLSITNIYNDMDHTNQCTSWHQVKRQTQFYIQVARQGGSLQNTHTNSPTIGTSLYHSSYFLYNNINKKSFPALIKKLLRTNIQQILRNYLPNKSPSILPF